MLGEALDHYGTYHAFCTNVLKLSAFDAQECCIALLCNVTRASCSISANA